MLISDLPPDIRRLVELRRKQSDTYEGTSIYNSFTWSATPEGIEFWILVSEGEQTQDEIDAALVNADQEQEQRV